MIELPGLVLRHAEPLVTEALRSATENNPAKLATARQVYDSKAHNMEQIAEVVGVSRAALYRHLDPTGPFDRRPVSAPGARSRLAKALVGPAGEHYVLSQLLIRGYLATLAPAGAPDVDLLVTGETGETFARVQVKTRSAAYGRLKAWTMSPRHEQLVHDRMFYALVDFEQQPTAVYVVPSAVVAQVISTASRLYQSTPGPRVAQRKPNSFRQIEQGYSPDMPEFRDGWMEPYRDRFDVLGEPDSDPNVATEQQIASE